MSGSSNRNPRSASVGNTSFFFNRPLANTSARAVVTATIRGAFCAPNHNCVLTTPPSSPRSASAPPCRNA